MAVSFNTVIEDKRNDGTYRIKILCYHNGRKKRIKTDIVVSSNDITSSGKLKNGIFSVAVEDLLQSYRKKCLNIIDQLPYMTVDDVVEYVTAIDKKQFNLNFIEFGEYLISRMKQEGNLGNASAYQTALNSLKRFAKSDNIDIREINSDFLIRYKDYLRTEPNQCNITAAKRKILSKGDGAYSTYARTIRAIFNQARAQYNDEDTGIIHIAHYPFKKIKIKEAPRKPREALTIEQFQTLINLPNKDHTYNIARDVFILSFCLLGSNSVDLYNCEAYKRGRIIYNRTKTASRRADNAEISILVPVVLLPILEKYKDITGKKIFSFYHSYANFKNFNKFLNETLKRVGADIGVPDLIYYTARRTWATIARNKLHISKDIIHDALNHADPRMKATDLYIDKDYSPVDEANKKVLALFDFSNYPPSL
jgi:integrase